MARERETYRTALELYAEQNEKVNGGRALLTKSDLSRLFKLDRRMIENRFCFPDGGKLISLPEAVRQLVAM